MHIEPMSQVQAPDLPMTFTCKVVNANAADVSWKFYPTDSYAELHDPSKSRPLPDGWLIKTEGNTSSISKDSVPFEDSGYYVCALSLHVEEHGLLQIEEASFACPRYLDTSESIRFSLSMPVSTITERSEISICSDTEYTCSDASCIRRSQVCDKKNDCPDGNDEVNCECDPTIRACKVSKSGQVPVKKSYNVNWECDGEDDCGNGYDEGDCA
ncbi:hypothetical protein Ciccas_006806, partial [Cichlidogyrus casuarinus]